MSVSNVEKQGIVRESASKHLSVSHVARQDILLSIVPRIEAHRHLHTKEVDHRRPFQDPMQKAKRRAVI